MVTISFSNCSSIIPRILSILSFLYLSVGNKYFNLMGLLSQTYICRSLSFVLKSISSRWALPASLRLSISILLLSPLILLLMYFNRVRVMVSSNMTRVPIWILIFSGCTSPSSSASSSTSASFKCSSLSGSESE